MVGNDATAGTAGKAPLATLIVIGSLLLYGAPFVHYYGHGSLELLFAARGMALLLFVVALIILLRRRNRHWGMGLWGLAGLPGVAMVGVLVQGPGNRRQLARFSCIQAVGGFGTTVTSVWLLWKYPFLQHVNPQGSRDGPLHPAVDVGMQLFACLFAMMAHAWTEGQESALVQTAPIPEPMLRDGLPNKPMQRTAFGRR